MHALPGRRGGGERDILRTGTRSVAGGEVHAAGDGSACGAAVGLCLVCGVFFGRWDLLISSPCLLLGLSVECGHCCGGRVVNGKTRLGFWISPSLP